MTYTSIGECNTVLSAYTMYRHVPIHCICTYNRLVRTHRPANQQFFPTVLFTHFKTNPTNQVSRYLWSGITLCRLVNGLTLILSFAAKGLFCGDYSTLSAPHTCSLILLYTLRLSMISFCHRKPI